MVGLDPPTVPHAAQPGNRILNVAMPCLIHQSEFVSLSISSRSGCHPEDGSCCAHERAALRSILRKVFSTRDPANGKFCWHARYHVPCLASESRALGVSLIYLSQYSDPME